MKYILFYLIMLSCGLLETLAEDFTWLNTKDCTTARLFQHLDLEKSQSTFSNLVDYVRSDPELLNAPGGHASKVVMFALFLNDLDKTSPYLREILKTIETTSKERYFRKLSITHQVGGFGDTSDNELILKMLNREWTAFKKINPKTWVNQRDMALTSLSLTEAGYRVRVVFKTLYINYSNGDIYLSESSTKNLYQIYDEIMSFERLDGNNKVQLAIFMYRHNKEKAQAGFIKAAKLCVPHDAHVFYSAWLKLSSESERLDHKDLYLHLFEKFVTGFSTLTEDSLFEEWTYFKEDSLQIMLKHYTTTKHTKLRDRIRNYSELFTKNGRKFPIISIHDTPEERQQKIDRWEKEPWPRKPIKIEY